MTSSETDWSQGTRAGTGAKTPAKVWNGLPRPERSSSIRETIARGPRPDQVLRVRIEAARSRPRPKLYTPVLTSIINV